MNSNKLSVAAERAVIFQFMPEDTYWDLYKKYGHETVFNAFSQGLATIQKPTWRQRMLWRVRKLRARVERMQAWLSTAEVADGDQA